VSQLLLVFVFANANANQSDDPYSPWAKWAFANIPGAMRLHRWWIFLHVSLLSWNRCHRLTSSSGGLVVLGIQPSEQDNCGKDPKGNNSSFGPLKTRLSVVQTLAQYIRRNAPKEYAKGLTPSYCKSLQNRKPDYPDTQVVQYQDANASLSTLAISSACIGLTLPWSGAGSTAL
jgi:hypothetical protein